MQFNYMLIISLAVLTTQCSAYKYIIDFVSDTWEDFVSGCHGMRNFTLFEIFDLDALTTDHFENGTFHIYGDTKIVADLPQELIKAKLETYKWHQGEWTSTLYNGETTNVCALIFLESVSWSVVLKNTPTEQKTCPIKFGQEFHFDFYSDILQLNMRDPYLEGKYKIKVRFESTTTKQAACISIIYNLFKL